jgi:diguanylate cyclase (GGDEF)-like protein
VESTEIGRPVEILLVEDNPGDARLAAEALKDSAFRNRLHWAADGVQAMEFLRRGGQNADAPTPDLILLDLNLPKKHGHELLAELKSDPDLKRIPVIVLTCSQAESDRDKAYALQASCYITKPSQWSEFLQTIRAIGDFWLTQVTLPGSDRPFPRVGIADRPVGTTGAPQVARVATDTGHLKILLVEDNPGDARLVREMIADAGNGQAALVDVGRLSDGVRRLGQETFDAVLLDLTLPDSEGLDTLVTLHAQATGVPLVVLTGLGDEEVAARALRQGAQDYLVKGKFDGGLLLRSVAHAIERMRSGREVHYLAHHDGLTDLPNRLLFQDRLGQAVERARRNDRTLAVLFLDLDHFKKINDTLGHVVGDDLLVHVAARLRGCVRASDTVARVGGDEFTILLPEIGRVEDVTTVAEKIMQTFASPIDIGGRELSVSVSIGASLYPNDGRDSEALVKSADAAMYRAKEQGRANCQFYSATAGAQATERHALSEDLRRALERDELLLHFQPTVDAVADKVIALEALLRWRRPNGDLAYPAEFLPLAEETGLIVEIGEWVLRRACAQGRAWQQAGLQPLRVSVNLSGRELHRGPALVEAVQSVLAETGLDPVRLEIEVTEESIARDEAGAIRTLRSLHEMGIRIAIDDFGTGNASLSRLKSLAFGSVKIDRSFVRNVAIDPDDTAIVAGIIAVGHSLRMTVAAEGVESGEQATFLLRHQIDQMQGPYFGEPLPADACTELLSAGARPFARRRPAASGDGHARGDRHGSGNGHGPGNRGDPGDDRDSGVGEEAGISSQSA